jgi:hypothetical protein
MYIFSPQLLYKYINTNLGNCPGRKLASPMAFDGAKNGTPTSTTFFSSWQLRLRLRVPTMEISPKLEEAARRPDQVTILNLFTVV